MGVKRKRREMLLLMGKNCISAYIRFGGIEKHRKKVYQDKINNPTHSFYEQRCKIFDLAKELKIDDQELLKIWLITEVKRKYHYNKYKKMPKATHRDNKTNYNYGSGSNYYSVRYPKKNRSKKTWTNFYNLFPNRARLDGWDGETSSRYNPKKK